MEEQDSQDSLLSPSAQEGNMKQVLSLMKLGHYSVCSFPNCTHFRLLMNNTRNSKRGTKRSNHNSTKTRLLQLRKSTRRRRRKKKHKPPKQAAPPQKLGLFKSLIHYAFVEVDVATGKKKLSAKSSVLLREDRNRAAELCEGILTTDHRRSVILIESLIFLSSVLAGASVTDLIATQEESLSALYCGGLAVGFFLCVLCVLCYAKFEEGKARKMISIAVMIIRFSWRSRDSSILAHQPEYFFFNPSLLATLVLEAVRCSGQVGD